MSEGISLDLASALPYAEDKLRKLFGRDAESMAAVHALEKQLRISATEANTVQIVGMDQPVSIFDIYQPTRLIQPSRRSTRTVSFESLLRQSQDAVVVGGPGAGKTTLAQYVFAHLSQTQEHFPILVTLRRTDAVKFLVRFVADLSAGRAKKPKNVKVVLLVDGYDEISTATRKRVAETLGDFAGLGVGSFYLTCRSFYSSELIKARRYEIAPFTAADSIAFIDAFSNAYGSPTDASALLAELTDHGLEDFAEHPLMLALVCILKAGPIPSLPRTPLGLIRRAISTLTFRWDEAKGISRDSRVKVDGEDRLRCLMKIAFEMKALIASDGLVQAIVHDFLDLLQRRDVNAQELLREMAQWYGILVPTADMQWTFVHRSIHDYLAAQYWVDSGFNADDVSEWNPRAAYAASLQQDATKSMLAALRSGDAGVAAFAECLYNHALFDPERIATAVIAYFRNRGLVKRVEPKCIAADTDKDFFALVGDEFLLSLAQVGASGATNAHRLVLAYALAELAGRNGLLPQSIRDTLAQQYDADMIFAATRGEQVVEVRWSKIRGA